MLCGAEKMPPMNWDVFLSYASDDALGAAVPLQHALERQGLSVWRDHDQLAVGDRLRDKINEGLSRSRAAVLILSRASLAKTWPRDEWQAVLALEEAGRGRLLPVRFEVTQPEVARSFPLIADRLALDMASGADRVAEAIARALGSEQARTEHSVLIDCSHGQDQWRNLARAAARLGGIGTLTTSWLQDPDKLAAAAVLLVPPPFHTRFTPPELDALEQWVDGGGGLAIFGCYDERHHKSNVSELAWRFDFEFGLDVVLPAGSDENAARAHVFSHDSRHAVRLQVAGDHPLVADIRELALVSSATLWPVTTSEPELLLYGPSDAVIMRPLGHILSDGSRPAIDKWEPSRTGRVPLVGARAWGRGKVVIIGSWKMITVDLADNANFIRNTVDWLGGGQRHAG
jgi:hypothetical protein